MQRSSTRFLILSIFVMAVLVVIASGLFLNFSNEFTNSVDVNVVEAASANQFSAGMASAGYGLQDGQVVSGYSPNTSGYTSVSITDDSSLKSFLSSNSGKYGIVSKSFTTTITYSNTYTLSGVLDGCGNTITMATDWTNNPNSEQFYGGLVQTLTGTIKNLTILTSADYHSTRNSYTGNSQGCGLVAGTINGGTVQNCKIIWDPESTSVFFNHVDSGGDYEIVLGGIAARAITGTNNITNVTIQMNAVFCNDSWSNRWGNQNHDNWTGGFIGGHYSGTTNFKNVTITGSGNIETKQTGGTVWGDSAALVGYRDGGTVNVNGVKIAYTGSCVCTSCSGDGSTWLLVGNGATYESGCLVIYSSSNTNWYKTKNSTGFADNERKYSNVADAQIGFVGDNLWIGVLSSYSGSTTSIKGSFVNTITIGSTAINVAGLASNGFSGSTGTPYVPTIAKSNVDGDITGYTTGTYSYLADEVGDTLANAITTSGSGPSLTLSSSSTNGGTFTGTYNGNAITISNLKKKLYINNSPAGVVIPVSTSLSPSTVTNAGTHNITATYASGVWSSSGEAPYTHYVIAATTYHAKIVLDKATLTLSPVIAPNEGVNKLVYSSNSQTGITINRTQLSGWVDADSTPTYSNRTAITTFTCASGTNSPTVTNSAGLATGGDCTVSAINAKTYSVTVTLVMPNYKISGFDANNQKTYSFTILPFTVNPNSTALEDTIFTYSGVSQKALMAPDVPASIAEDVDVYYYYGRQTDKTKTNANAGLTAIPSATPIINIGQYCIYVAAEEISDPNYDVASGWINYIIQPAPITPTRVEKSYDATTAATYIDTSKNTFSGLVNNEADAVLGFSASQSIGTYASKNVQSGGAVTFASSVFYKYSLIDNSGATHYYWLVNSTAQNLKNYRVGEETTAGAASYTPSFNVGYITAVDLTIKADNQSITYGDAAPTYTVTYTGLQGANTATEIAETTGLTITCPYNATTGNANRVVGNYTITAANATNANYNITFQTGTLSVSKRAITVTIADKTSIYGNTAAALTASQSATYYSETPYSLSIASSITNKTASVGTYPITGTNTNTANYNITFSGSYAGGTKGTYTITARPITVTIADKTSLYGPNMVALTAAITTGSAVNGATVYTICSFTTTATSSSDVGTYPITGTRNDSNYSVTFVGSYTGGTQGTYTITASPVRILLDDTKELYDSIMDYDKNGHYDFIYVLDSTGYTDADYKFSITNVFNSFFNNTVSTNNVFVIY